MKLLKTFNLSGSSIIEAVIATLIIAICSMLAIMIYVNVSNSVYSLPMVKGKNKLKELYIETILEDNYDDIIIENEGYKIIKKVNTNNTTKGIIEVQFEIKTEKKNHKTLRYIKKSR